MDSPTCQHCGAELRTSPGGTFTGPDGQSYCGSAPNLAPWHSADSSADAPEGLGPRASALAAASRDIIAHASRLAWASAWANMREACGATFFGCDILELAPSDAPERFTLAAGADWSAGLAILARTPEGLAALQALEDSLEGDYCDAEAIGRELWGSASGSGAGDGWDTLLGLDPCDRSDDARALEGALQEAFRYGHLEHVDPVMPAEDPEGLAEARDELERYPDFPELAEAIGREWGAEAADAATLYLAESDGSPDLRELGEALEHVMGSWHYGLESVSCGDSEAEYLNTGDTYSATLLEDSDGIHVTSWGGWLEAAEQAREEETGESRCTYCGEWDEGSCGSLEAEADTCTHCGHGKDGSDPPTEDDSEDSEAEDEAREDFQGNW